MSKYKLTYYLNIACAERRPETMDDFENDWIEEEKEFSLDLEAFEYLYKKAYNYDDEDLINDIYEDLPDQDDLTKINAIKEEFDSMNDDPSFGATIVISLEGPGQTYDSGYEKENFMSEDDDDYDEDDYDEDEEEFDESLNLQEATSLALQGRLLNEEFNWKPDSIKSTTSGIGKKEFREYNCYNDIMATCTNIYHTFETNNYIQFKEAKLSTYNDKVDNEQAYACMTMYYNGINGTDDINIKVLAITSPDYMEKLKQRHEDRLQNEEGYDYPGFNIGSKEMDMYYTGVKIIVNDKVFNSIDNSFMQEILNIIKNSDKEANNLKRDNNLAREDAIEKLMKLSGLSREEVLDIVSKIK